jgi:hypothetical protein
MIGVTMWKCSSVEVICSFVCIVVVMFLCIMYCDFKMTCFTLLSSDRFRIYEMYMYICM